jgi:hypothetical protein
MEQFLDDIKQRLDPEKRSPFALREERVGSGEPGPQPA